MASRLGPLRTATRHRFLRPHPAPRLASTSSRPDDKSPGRRYSGSDFNSSGEPSRRIPVPQGSEARKKGAKKDDGNGVKRATAATPAAEVEETEEKAKGKGKADTGDEAEVPPITERSTISNPGSTASTSSALSQPSPSGEGPPAEGGERKPISTTHLAGPVDIYAIPSLRSSFEEPLVGLSPSLSPGSDATASSSAGGFISRSPSTGPTPSSDGGEEVRDATALSLLPRHSFNTHRFVLRLDSSTFQRPLAVALLSSTSSILHASQRRLLTGPDGAVSKPYAEGQAYLYSAALSELRTEVQVKARNDGIALRSVVNGLQREVEALRQRMGEDVGNLRNEIQIEMNQRKEEGSGEMKSLEMGILELNSKFTILVGDVRTEIEARKWVTTRRCIVAIAGLALAVILYTASLEELAGQPASSTPSQSRSTVTEGTQTESGLSLRTAEELGIRPSEGDSTSGGFLWGTGFGKRVGEEEVGHEVKEPKPR